MLLVVSACTSGGMNNNVVESPEKLLDTSSEKVSFGLSSYQAIGELANWIEGDKPSHAELRCSGQRQECREAELVLRQASVKYSILPASAEGNDVVLYYDRVLARDCDQRFINNSYNPSNEHYSGFGCATAVNTVQMVNDHKQFTNPVLLGPQDASSAARVYRSYVKDR